MFEKYISRDYRKVNEKHLMDETEMLGFLN